MDSVRQAAEETIYALSSGAGVAGVAVVRVSGPAAGECLARLSGGRLPAPRVASLRRLADDEGLIDQALVLWMPGPGSFTGEDVAEFHVHGGRAVVRRLLTALENTPGLRPAREGEFTRRAFEAGRMSLLEVEGLADLLRAETEAQRRQAAAAAGGETARRAEAWRAELIHVLSRLEAAIDFCEEEDIAEEALKGMEARLAALLAEMEAALRRAETGEALRDGVRVVLAGPPNAGKSSLLNALAGREAAIVSEEAGTTRDVIEARLDIAGAVVILSDTAGLRAGAGGEIERIGQERTRARLREADLVLWMESPDVESGEIPHVDSDMLRILNKCDLLDSPPSRSGYDLYLSIAMGKGLEALETRLHEWIRERYDLVTPAMIFRERQRMALESCVDHLRGALEKRGAPVEIRAEMARLAARDLERLVGRVDVEDLLDRIFGEFCIGK